MGVHHRNTFINDCIFILVGHLDFVFMIVDVIGKIGGNDNSPKSLNVMVHYHYHGEIRVMTW